MKLILGELESLLNKKFTAGYQSVVDETNARRVRPCNLNRGSGHERGGGLKRNKLPSR